ncbi:putative surface protease GP63, partial [Trypanosoma theileri]
TVAHEIAHGLGFDGTTFAHLKMISAVENDVRGKPHVFLVVSPKAKEVAQKYYNCSKAPGLELEDQGNSALSHFEMRNVRGELMSPKAPGGGSYSALTLAVFDDMPFYKANFSRAEPLRWANNSGCDFLEKKCIENKTSNFPDIFCTATVRIKGYLQCTYDRMALGQCLRKTYPEVIEPHFQYLWNAHLGGTEFWMDYCPYVEKVRYGDCTDGRRSTIIGSFVGPDARCVKGNELKYRTTPIGDVCVNTKCEEEGKLSVQFQGDDEWYQCEEGAHVKSNSANWSGTITCPKYADVCTRYPNITNKEPLPEVTDKDNEPAPANITWPIKPKDPSPLPHPTPEPTMETVGAPHVERELTSSNPNVPTDSSGHHTSERDGLFGSTTHIDNDTKNNLATNGKGPAAHVPNNSDTITLNIGIGDGTVTPAGHAPLLLLIFASVVAVVVPL